MISAAEKALKPLTTTSKLAWLKMLTTTTDSRGDNAARRYSISDGTGERAALINKLRPVLAGYPEIIFGYLFGSKALGTDGATSDVDLAVYVLDQRTFSFARKLTLHGDCCRALQRNNVDLVVLNQTRNLMLLEQIVQHGVIILDQDPGQRLDVEVKILHQALDFRQQRQRETGV